MQLSTFDWSIIIGFFILSIIIGIIASKKAGESYSDFFLSGRNMPWWLLGFSMVATTFSADTPNLVTDIVRKNGVSGNWQWWAFLLTGMLTVFVYAKLWRRSGVNTDLEFYELRYSGKAAAFLRGFRALYLGVFFNVMVMATVALAAIKIGGVMLGLTPIQTILIASIVTVIYSSLGGLTGIIWTDFFQFIIAMIGVVGAAIIIVNLPEVGGVTALLEHPNVTGKLDVIPDFNDMDALVPLFILPLAVQWWSVWYPGAEPGGGGYIAQRMLSAKNENHAIGATMFFNFAHYALRPWPWILVALASIVIFPLTVDVNEKPLIVAEEAEQMLTDSVGAKDIEFLINGINYKQSKAESKKTESFIRLKSLVENNQDALEIKSLAYIYSRKNKDEADQKKWSNPLDDEQLVHLQLAFPKTTVDKLGNDLAYPAMMTFLPHGLLGLVLASLIAAFMSTISTQLNWGSSYIVNDYYKRFIKPDANEKNLVNVGRLSTVVLMVLAGLVALALENALGAFNILLQIGAGTGLIFILRWFWWRINAWSEVTAMIVSFLVALYFEFLNPDVATHIKLISGVSITTIAWLAVTFMTQPTEHSTLLNFYKLIKPHASGWQAVIQPAISKGELQTDEVTPGKLPLELTCMIAGCFLVYGVLFGVGFFLYGNLGNALVGFAVAAITGFILWKSWVQVKGRN